MTTVGSVNVGLGVDDRRFTSGLNSAERRMKSFGQRMGQIGGQMQRVGGAMTKSLTLPIVAAGVMGMKLAMELEATEAKYNTVFKGMTDTVDQFIKDFQKLTPATTAEARSMYSGIQDLLIPMGFLREDATELTGKTMHLVGALTNFNSATHDADQVSQAFASALTGMYRPLKSLGIDTEKAEVQQKALAMTGKKTTDELTRQDEALALIEIAYENSTDALAAYNEESLDAKTRLGLATAEVKDAAAELFYNLLPAIEAVSKKIRELADWMKELTPQQEKMLFLVAGIAAAAGPLLIILGTLLKAVGAIAAVLSVKLLIVIGAVIAVVALLVKHWDDIYDVIQKVWGFLEPIFMPILQELWESIKELVEVIQEFWKENKDVLLPVLKVVAGVLVGLVAAAILFVIGTIYLLVRASTAVIRAFRWVVNAGREVHRFFQNLAGIIGRALRGVDGAIRGAFRKAFDWVIKQSDKVKDALNKINPFSKSSPSLVDNVRKGTKIIANEYEKMLGTISNASVNVRGNLQTTTAPIEGTLQGPPVFNITMQAGMYAGTEMELENLSEKIIEKAERVYSSRGKGIIK